MLPVIQREVIDRRKWMDCDDFLEMLTLAQSSPGPISLNTSVFVGYRLRGYWGAVVAMMGIVIPSFTVILLIVLFFSDIKDNPAVEAVFKGMRPAAVALIVAPMLGLAKGMNFYKVGIAIVVAAAIWRLGVSPILLIIAGGLGGVLWMVLRSRKGGAR